MSTFGPYTPIVIADNMFFVSGQIGVDPATKLAGSDIEAQTKQALHNLKHLVESHGLSLKDIKKTTVFLTDMDDFAAMNSIYQEFFDDPRPARSCVAVKELPRIGENPLRIEIEAIGAIGS